MVTADRRLGAWKGAQGVPSAMPTSDNAETRLDQLLRESAALRKRSEALAKEAERLRADIKANGAAERRKKPRLKGK
jgi:hypothetical protein